MCVCVCVGGLSIRLPATNLRVPLFKITFAQIEMSPSQNAQNRSILRKYGSGESRQW